VEEQPSGLKSALPAEKRRKGGGWERTEESNIEAPVGIRKLPSQAEERGNGGIDCGMESRSCNQDRGSRSVYPCGGALQEKELTAEGYRGELI